MGEILRTPRPPITWNPETSKLGKKLSKMEQKLSDAITSREGFFSVDELAGQVYSDFIQSDLKQKAKDNIHSLLGRVRKKLGTRAIVFIDGKGYRADFALPKTEKIEEI